MKTWIGDILIGWVSAWITNIFLILLIGGYPDWIFVIIFSILISLIPGVIGGYLGGKYIKHQWGNVIGGVILGIAFTLIIRF